MNNIINPNNEKPSDEEISKISEWLKKISLDTKVTIETPPEVYEILWHFYNEDNIFLKNIERLEDNIFKLWFIFPKYNLSKKWLDHVSGVQMTLARFQALYTAIWLAIKTGSINQLMSYEIFLANMYNVLDREYQITHSKICFPGEMVFLIVQVNEPIIKWNFYTIECKFLRSSETFLHGSEKCVLENRFIAK